MKTSAENQKTSKVRVIGVLGVLFGMAIGGLALSSTAFAGGVPDLVFKPASQLSLEGDSTLHAFHSKTKKLKIDVKFASGGGGDKTGAEAVKELLKAGKIVDLTVTIPVETLKSGEGALDTNMYKALATDKHPNIRFKLASYKVAGPDSNLDITAKGTLTINGKDKDVTLKADGKLTGDTIRVTGKESFNMSEYGVKPPELMFGTIKVKDKVTVSWDLVGDLK